MFDRTSSIFSLLLHLIIFLIPGYLSTLTINWKCVRHKKKGTERKIQIKSVPIRIFQNAKLNVMLLHSITQNNKLKKSFQHVQYSWLADLIPNGYYTNKGRLDNII